MAGSGSTGVDKALVAKMTQVLMDSKVDIDKVNVDKPAGGTMGGSKTAGNLSSLVDLATDRIELVGHREHLPHREIACHGLDREPLLGEERLDTVCARRDLGTHAVSHLCR